MKPASTAANRSTSAHSTTTPHSLAVEDDLLRILEHKLATGTVVERYCNGDHHAHPVLHTTPLPPLPTREPPASQKQVISRRVREESYVVVQEVCVLSRRGTLWQVVEKYLKQPIHPMDLNEDSVILDGLNILLRRRYPSWQITATRFVVVPPLPVQTRNGPRVRMTGGIYDDVEVFFQIEGYYGTIDVPLWCSYCYNCDLPASQFRESVRHSKGSATTNDIPVGDRFVFFRRFDLSYIALKTQILIDMLVTAENNGGGGGAPSRHSLGVIDLASDGTDVDNDCVIARARILGLRLVPNPTNGTFAVCIDDTISPSEEWAIHFHATLGNGMPATEQARAVLIDRVWSLKAHLPYALDSITRILRLEASHLRRIESVTLTGFSYFGKNDSPMNSVRTLRATNRRKQIQDFLDWSIQYMLTHQAKYGGKMKVMYIRDDELPQIRYAPPSATQQQQQQRQQEEKYEDEDGWLVGMFKRLLRPFMPTSEIQEPRQQQHGPRRSLSHGDTEEEDEVELHDDTSAIDPEEFADVHAQPEMDSNEGKIPVFMPSPDGGIFSQRLVFERPRRNGRNKQRSRSHSPNHPYPND